MTGCEVCHSPDARLRRTPDEDYVLCRDCWAEVQTKWARLDDGARDEAMDMLAEMRRDDDD